MLSDALGLVIGSYEPPCGCRESKPGLPEEQPALLTTAPLQPLKIGGLSFSARRTFSSKCCKVKDLGSPPSVYTEFRHLCCAQGKVGMLVPLHTWRSEDGFWEWVLHESVLPVPGN